MSHPICVANHTQTLQLPGNIRLSALPHVYLLLIALFLSALRIFDTIVPFVLRLPSQVAPSGSVTVCSSLTILPYQDRPVSFSLIYCTSTPAALLFGGV